jgi:serine phosphatase RsbU (regulator of sigma subunit)
MRVVPLEGERYTLGRAPNNDLCFHEDAGLSRNHLAIERSGASWAVVDLGSRNGTKVNGIAVAPRRILISGDRITAGSLLLEFKSEDESRSQSVEFVDSPLEIAAGATVVANLDNIMRSGRALLSTQSGGPSSRPQVHPLVRAGQELAGHRPLNELFPTIMNLAVEAVGATRGVLMILENGELETRAAKGDGFKISNTVRDQVLKKKESLLVRDVRLDEMLRAQASIVAQAVRSMMAVPLQTSDNVLGLIYVDSPHMVRPFTAEDLNLLTVMANIAAIRIEHARLLEVEKHDMLIARDMQQAAEIQKSLLPGNPPAIEGLDVAAMSEACRSVGGDYYDFFLRSGGRQVFLVGDVAGKGMPAALLMTSLQARVQVLLEEPIEIAALVSRLNSSISTSCPGNRFITFFICEIDPSTGEVTYCNAGHNPPLLVGSGGKVMQLADGGPVLGVLPRFPFTQHHCTMEPGDVLVMYTDGVTEAEKLGSDEEFGEKRLLQLIRDHHSLPVDEIVKTVTNAVASFAGSVTASDDFTAVVIRKTAARAAGA